MSGAALFTICAFAIWRAALVISTDRGPFDVFRNIRNRIDPMKRTWYGEGIRCEMCLSFWLGLFTSLALWYWGRIPGEYVVFWWLGLSGAAVFIDSVARK